MKPSISKVGTQYWLTIDNGSPLKNQTIVLKAKNFKQAQKEAQEILTKNRNYESI